MTDYKQEVMTLIKSTLGWDNIKVSRWMSLPNPLLGNITPNEMIERDRGEKLLKFVKSQLDENYP